MIEISFSDNKDEAFRIMRRAKKLGYNFIPSEMDFIMDVCAADGVNGNAPIDFEKWQNSDDLNFLHDADGIHRNMNRETGELDNFFVPRFAIVN